MKSPRQLHLFRGMVAPLQGFLRLEAASGILLFCAAVVALGWANSPLAPTHRVLFETQIPLGGSLTAPFTLIELVNDGLMTVFFFVVGMEMKRELAVGALRTFAQAALPAIAALGGMALPAMIYFLFNRHTPGERGWGIPMATDIAFCIGCLTLLKGRVPQALVVFVTALAIFDDLGGILVIAFFYGHGLDLLWLGAAGGLTLVLFLFNRLEVRRVWPYLLAGCALWACVQRSGIHATLSGVVLGLMIPIRTPMPPRSGPEQKAPLELLMRQLHPWVAFGVMPLFALANAGIDLRGSSWAQLAMPIPLGTAVGLFVGKQAGIFLFTQLAVAIGFAPMPGGASRWQLYGASVLAGIGFTVALFIASLAFPMEPALLAQAKLGILLGSIVSGVTGYLLLRLGSVRTVLD